MNDINTEADNYLEAADLYKTKNLLLQMQKLAQMQIKDNGKKVIGVMNANLYRLAMRYYGNSDEWTVIAEANGLSDPEISGYMELIIPNWDGKDRGGLFDGK